VAKNGVKVSGFLQTAAKLAWGGEEGVGHEVQRTKGGLGGAEREGEHSHGEKFKPKL